MSRPGSAATGSRASTDVAPNQPDGVVPPRVVREWALVNSIALALTKVRPVPLTPATTFVLAWSPGTCGVCGEAVFAGEGVRVEFAAADGTLWATGCHGSREDGDAGPEYCGPLLMEVYVRWHADNPGSVVVLGAIR